MQTVLVHIYLKKKKLTDPEVLKINGQKGRVKSGNRFQSSPLRYFIFLHNKAWSLVKVHLKPLSMLAFLGNMTHILKTVNMFKRALQACLTVIGMIPTVCYEVCSDFHERQGKALIS